MMMNAAKHRLCIPISGPPQCTVETHYQRFTPEFLVMGLSFFDRVLSAEPSPMRHPGIQIGVGNIQKRCVSFCRHCWLMVEYKALRSMRIPILLVLDSEFDAICGSVIDNYLMLLTRSRKLRLRCVTILSTLTCHSNVNSLDKCYNKVHVAIVLNHASRLLLRTPYDNGFVLCYALEGDAIRRRVKLLKILSKTKVTTCSTIQ
ncbi:hypothetical protein KXD40_007632 [Peronospora effusa]|nr:hypothetical protein KXD40_007632 [Peronospora effusa]